MMNQKPTTSLEEDLKTLGLMAGDVSAKPLAEDGGMDGDEATEPKADKDEKKDEKAEKADKKDDKKDHKEPDGDEKPSKSAGPPPGLAAMLAKKEAEENAVSYTEQLEAAWDVVHHFYRLAEGEDAELTSEDLRTVIEAQSLIIEAAYNDAEPTSEPKDIPGANKVDAFPDGEDPIKQNAAHEGPLGLGKKVAVAGDGYNLAKTGAAKGDKGAPYSPRHRSQPAPTNESASLGALVNELKSLQTSVQESGPTSEQLEISQQLIEGFEAVRDTAAAVFKGIDAELAESKAEEGDPRFNARAHFESIANDAAEILNAISTGDVDIADAAADLNTISGDLKAGLDGLQGVA